MKRNRVLAAVLGLLSIPSLLALSEAVSFYARNANNGSIISSGERREYIVHVPRDYDARKPVPLVISLHAAALWPATQVATTQWDRIADAEGFIVVYPAGSTAGGPRIWHVDGTPDMAKDVRFISDLIDTLRAHYDIDTTRIFANGLSNGGGMAFVLSCMLSKRIAAVGLVASAQTLPFEWCTNRKPVPMLAIHGTADPVVKYEGGASWAFPRGFPNFPRFVESWAQRNRCSATPVEVTVAADVTLKRYTGCSADVEFYTVKGGGHSWPGGQPLAAWMVGPTSMSIDASRTLWQFFQAHPLRP